MHTDFLSLSADPEEAFVEYQRLQLEKYESADGSGWFFERAYVDALLAFDEVYALGVFFEFAEPPSKDHEFADYFARFRRHANKTAIKYQLEHARRTKAAPDGIIVLDANSRSSLRTLIDALRSELDKLTLTEAKRGALVDKLNAFAAEVEHNLTRTEALFSFAVDFSRTAGQAGAEFKPISDRVDRILDIVERAQKWVESLPPWAKRKELPAPPKQIEGPKFSESEDDIPF